jgi:hypothetical protein
MTMFRDQDKMFIRFGERLESGVPGTISRSVTADVKTWLAAHLMAKLIQDAENKEERGPGRATVGRRPLLSPQ